MPDPGPRPVVLDTTVISNFSSSHSIDWLLEFLDQPIVTQAVRDELEQGVDEGYSFLGVALDALHEKATVEERDIGEGLEPFRDIRNRLNAGETTSLQAAFDRDGMLATDDLAARTLASDMGLPVTGSIGLLLRGIEQGTLDAETADHWLDLWRTERGYYAPVTRVSELLDLQDE